MIHQKKNETFVSMIHTFSKHGNASFRVLFVVQTYTKLYIYDV